MNAWLLLGALNGLIAVAAGAYGWHWLAVAESGLRDIFMVGVHFQMWHALALIGTAWVTDRTVGRARKAADLAGWCFVLGALVFSGTLYVLGLTGGVPVKFAAPVGGFLLMGGWIALMAAAWWGRDPG